jgi:hypothetical protein
MTGKDLVEAAERVIAFLETCGDADIRAGVGYILGNGSQRDIVEFKGKIADAICGNHGEKKRSVLGGFPWHCLDGCMTPGDCMMVGCLKQYLKDGLAKYAGRPNTLEVREQIAADMVDLYRAYGEKKR